LVFRKSSKNLI